eukprot:403341885
MQQQNQQHIPYFAQDSDLIDDDSKFKSYGVINQQKIKEAKYEINIISSNDSVLQAYQQEVSMSQESSSTLNLGAALQNNSNSNMSDIRHSNLNKIIMAPDQITQFDTMGEEFYNQLNQEYNENLQDEENEVSVQQTLQQYINDYQEVDFERLDQTTMDRDNINNRTLMQGSLSEIQKDRPLSLLEKNNKFRSSMIQDQSQDSIQKSQRNDLLKEIEIQQDEHQLSFSKTLPQKVQLLECDHLNTSHEELIDFSKPFGEARSPQVISNNLLLPKFNFNLTGSVTPVNLNHTQEMNFTNNFQMVQRQQFKAKRLEEKRQQLEKELHKCIVQQQIYSNKLQQRTSQDIKIENSKLDIGLARCFINRNIMSKYLSQDKAEEAEVFYALEVRTPDNGPSINNQDNVVKIQRFESDKITMKSQSQLLQWNQTFTVNLEQGLETISLKVYMFSITLGNIEIEKLEIQIDNQLPKLMDQKIKQVPFITEKECAFEIIVKWRYDDTKQKFQEISKRIRKIRQMLEQYTKRVNDAVSENSPVVNQAKSNFDRQLEYGFVEIYNATPHFSNGQMKKEQNTDEYSTTGQKKKVLARLTSSRSPSKYSSGRLSQLGSKSDHSQSRLSLAPNTTHLKQSQNIMPAPNHLSSVVNRQANSPKHSRIPSFSNTNDFGILSKTSRIHYQQNQHDKDEFSTVQLDQDSPDDKLKMKESNEFVRQSKRSKINRLQNQLEKKFQKIGNMTVKIPTRNSSVALTSQNQTKEQELKKESLIDIKDRVKRQNQSISVGDFQQQNNLAHKDTTIANIQLQNAQTSPKLSSPDQNAQSQNDEIQKSYIYSNSPLESAKVITNYQKAQLILGSENLDQNEESFGINKEQKLSARVSEIPQFKGILPSQMATQMIKDRQSIQHEIKGKGKNITSIINSTNFSQTQTLKKNESLKHFVPASHHTKPNVQQSSQVHSSTINLKTQQIQQKYQNQKFSSTTQQVSQNPEQLHFQNSQIVNNSNYSSKQNSLTASQINLNQNNFNTNRQPQSKQITITDIKNLKRKKSIELSMLKSARSSLNSSIDSKRHATGLIKGLHGTNISASGATGGGVNIYKTKKVVELTLIPLDQKSPNSQQISYKSQININKEKSQQDLKSGSRNLEEEKDGSLTRSLGRFFKNLF